MFRDADHAVAKQGVRPQGGANGPGASCLCDVGEVGAFAFDPQGGDALLHMGTLRVTHGVDLDRSAGTGQSGNMALVYDSGTVGVRPIVQGTLQLDNATPLPTSIDAELVWNGAVVATQTFYPGANPDISPGSLMTLALQVPTALTGVGRHVWEINLTDGDVGSYRDELGRMTTYTSDGMGRRLSEVTPIAGISTSWVYSAAGLMTQMTDAELRVSTNEYDARGLLIKTTQAQGSGTPAIELYTHDAAGQMVGRRDANEWWTYLTHDAAGRVVGTTDALGYSSSVVYDLAGRRTGMGRGDIGVLASKGAGA